MDTTPYRDWFSTRIDIADNIYKTYKKIGEADAQIVICCAIGTLSAMYWPDTEDNRRFIEFLAKFTPQTQKISIPIVIEKFFDEGDSGSAEKLIKQYYSSRSDYNGLWYLDNQVLPEPLMLKNLDSTKIDQTELNIAKVLSKEIHLAGKEKVNLKWADNLLPKGKDKRQVIRDASYAALIYTDFRCGLVHLYEGKNGVTSIPYPGRRDAPIYVNQSTSPTDEFIKKFIEKAASEYSLDPKVYSYDDVRMAFTETKRRLYFPYEYIRNLMVEASKNAFDEWERWDEPSSYQKPDIWAGNKPPVWWIAKYKKRSKIA
jgi:hypothetical protein